MRETECGSFEGNYFDGEVPHPHRLREENQEPAAFWRTRGQRLLTTGRYWQALEAYLKVFQARPDDFGLAILIGDIYVTVGKLEDAVVFYLRAVTHLTQDGKNITALAVLEKVAHLKPDDMGVKQIIANIHMDIRNNATQLDAIQSHEYKAIEHLLILTKQQRDHGDQRAALASCKRIIDIDPRHHQAVLLAARLYQELQEPENAFQLLEKTILLLQRGNMMTEASNLADEATAMAPGNETLKRLQTLHRRAEEHWELHDLQRLTFRF